jgi:hypothetical protein
LIPPNLLEPLREAADRVTDKSRKGEWTQVRVVGKQFPPWKLGENGDDDVWGVQNLMHPDLGEHVFSEWYGSQGMLEVSAGLMGREVDDMQFGQSCISLPELITDQNVVELFNLLVNPLHKTYALSWHRDDVKATATPSEETEALAIKHYGIQWNAALYDDDCLSAIPRSHTRIRSEQERQANLENGDMPGKEVLRLKAGEVVFYNNNIRTC